MNTKLLNQVAEAILDEPRKFNMDDFVMPSDKSPCGTACCIGGHAIAIAYRYKKLSDVRQIYDRGCTISSAAKAALKLVGFGAENLFYTLNWPTEFKEAYDKSKSFAVRAEIAFWRIQHFIATEGAE